MDICKMLCLAMLQLISFKALLYFRHLYYFSWDHIFQGASSFHSALFPSGRFISFMALYFSCIAPFNSCIAPFCSCIALYSDSVWVSTCISAPIVSQLRYFTFLPNCHAAIISISWCEALISWLVSEIFDDCVYQYQY